MTVLGKIFSILLLIMSLVFGAFAVFLYATQTHWSIQYADLEKRYKVAQASADQYAAEAQKTKNDTSKEVAELRAANKKLEEESTSQRGVITNLRANEQTMQLAKTQAEATATRAQSEVTRMQADNDHLKATVKKQLEDNAKLVALSNERLQDKTAAEIKANALADRNKRMEEQIQDQARELARIKSPVASATGAAKGTVKNPPQDSIEGLIRQTDNANGLVKITIGSDAGLLKGHTLEVFRLSSVPEQSKYLGTIRIIDVSNTEAVGVPMGRMAAPLEVGDHVASRILGG